MKFWLLSGLFVLSAGVNEEVAVDRATQAILGKHTTNTHFDHRRWVLRHHFFWRSKTLTTGIPRVAYVLLLVPLVSCESDFRSVDHHNIVATVGVWGEISLVLTAKYVCNLAADTAEVLSFSIDEQPLLVCSFLVARDGFVT